MALRLKDWSRIKQCQSSMPDVIKLPRKEFIQNEEFISDSKERGYKNNLGIAEGQPTIDVPLQEWVPGDRAVCDGIIPRSALCG